MSNLVVLDPFTPRPTDPNADEVIDPYQSAKVGRHVSLAVTWESKAITRDLAPHLISLTYADNLSGAADDLSLELEDRDHLWSGDWRPAFGDHLVARLDTTDRWFAATSAASAQVGTAAAIGTPSALAAAAAAGAAGFTAAAAPLRLGTFAHDEISYEGGSGTKVTLKCVSAPLATGLRRRKRTHAWRGVTLKRIAQDIADRAQLRLDFQIDPGPAYKNAVQNDKSDLEFLEEQCKEIGAILKITESTIVVYDELKLDSGPSIGNISLKSGNVLSWSFTSSESGRYGSCHVSCFDPRTGKTAHGQFPPDGTTIPGLDPNGQTLELVIQVSDASEAATRAQKLLRNANRFATSGKLRTVGDPGLVAGVVFNLTDAFGFDGKFIITRAEHHVGNGYVCELDVRRCIEGY